MPARLRTRDNLKRPVIQVPSLEHWSQLVVLARADPDDPGLAVPVPDPDWKLETSNNKNRLPYSVAPVTGC